jgi:hypothetical protein
VKKEFKSCPFCGCEPRFIERKCDKTKYGIGCSNMDCIIWVPEDVHKRELHNYVICFVDKDEMTHKWNKRTQ